VVVVVADPVTRQRVVAGGVIRSRRNTWQSVSRSCGGPTTMAQLAHAGCLVA
jgi:hypothetical protein